MILDTLANSHLYEGFHPSFPKAFAWLHAFDPALADGKYEIDDAGTLAIVQRYESAPSTVKKWETHRVHGDIQVVYSGEEFIGYTARGELTVTTPYLPEKDAEFYEAPAGSSSRLVLSKSCFAVFLPDDAHQPGVMINQPEPIVKVVVKFRI